MTDVFMTNPGGVWASTGVIIKVLGHDLCARMETAGNMPPFGEALTGKTSLASSLTWCAGGDGLSHFFSKRMQGLELRMSEPQTPRDPSIQIILTWGPKVCKYYLHWVFWIPRERSPM